MVFKSGKNKQDAFVRAQRSDSNRAGAVSPAPPDYRDGLTPWQRRNLEKRYGDVKELLRKRAEELGLDMNPRTEGIVRIEDSKRMVRHIREYDGTHTGLLAADIRNVVNLYDVNLDGVGRELHVAWIFKDISEFTKSRYRYNAYLEHDGMLYRELYEDRGAHREQMGIKPFVAVYRDPSLMVRIDELLLKSFVEAVNFYEWRYVPKGLVISGDNVLADASTGAMETFGNDALGIGVGRQLTDYLFRTSDAKLQRILGDSVKSMFVHELTHLHKKDFGEIVEFAMNLMFNPKNNTLMIADFRSNLDSWISKQYELEDHDAMKHGGPYEFQRYMGLMLVANEFAKHNPRIRRLFDSDDTENRFVAAKSFLDMMNESDLKKVIASGFIDRLLDGDIVELVKQIDITAL